MQIQDGVKSGEMSISAMGGGRRAVCSESREAECIELGQSRHQDREGADLLTGGENKTGDVMGHRWTSRHPSSALDTQENVLCDCSRSGHALEKGSVTWVQKRMRSLLSQEMFAFKKLPSIINRNIFAQTSQVEHHKIRILLLASRLFGFLEISATMTEEVEFLPVF